MTDDREYDERHDAEQEALEGDTRDMGGLTMDDLTYKLTVSDSGEMISGPGFIVDAGDGLIVIEQRHDIGYPDCVVVDRENLMPLISALTRLLHVGEG